VARFLSETFDPATRETSAKEMTRLFGEWCSANHERPLTGKQLGEALRGHGLEPGKSGSVRQWRWPLGQQGRQDGKNGKLPYTRAREELSESAVQASLVSQSATPDGVTPSPSAADDADDGLDGLGWFDDPDEAGGGHGA
jgi:hypothetical protein